ncbi:CASP-like protein 4B1 [Chenopodium quinoa]|uniref:CASP-like protein 4B1 n=1 Tax=Chenopodium quinoa TaxID=63459 RepID=UPI000B79980C|nr:CASP-like protein 4B1 [Chenopodium quinoa]
MSNSVGLELERKASPGNDMERGSPVAAPASGETEHGVGSILRRWKREDLIKKGSLTLRALSLVFSLLSFIIMASNNHGGGQDFGNYEEFRYLLAIAILSTLYTGLQCFRHVNELSRAKEFVDPKTAAMIDFVGDQILAYLLLSSASSAIPMTNRMREGGDNIFTDSCAAAISMSLLAFISLACSSVIAGYKLSTQSFI